MSDERTPLHNIEAERAVLGSLMTMPRLMDELAEHLDGGDFYQPRHEAIWSAAVAVHASGRRPDMLTIGKELGADELARVGGQMYLMDLTAPEVTLAPAQAPYYAKLVRDAAIGRRLIEATTAIRQRVESAEDIRAAAEDARRIIDQAASEAATVDTGTDVAALSLRTLEALDSEVDAGIATGWSDLDEYVNGLRPGQLAVVGARPSVGKSVIAANVAANAARAGVGVHFASLEMTRDEVMKRLLSAHCTVNLGHLMNHRLTERDWQQLHDLGGQVRSWPMWIDDQPSQSLLQLRARARSTARRLPLGLIVVDYLQLMAPRDRRVPREQQVGELSEGLKGLAKELGVPVLALAQVNRGSADRTDKRPVMSDLRESGRIEADADHVWLLHRQDLVDPNSTTGEIEVHVAKNRNGTSGQTVRLMFQGQYSRATLRAYDPGRAIA